MTELTEQEIYDFLKIQEELDRKKLRKGKEMTAEDKELDKAVYFALKGVRGPAFDRAYKRILDESHKRRR